jgi:hypothetical protein
LVRNGTRITEIETRPIRPGRRAERRFSGALPARHPPSGPYPIVGTDVRHTFTPPAGTCVLRAGIDQAF